MRHHGWMLAVLALACGRVDDSQNADSGAATGGRADIGPEAGGSGGEGRGSGGTRPGTGGGTTLDAASEACAALTFQPEALSAAVFIVLDRSAAMNALIPQSNESYWEAAKRAINEYTSLPNRAGEYLALSYFPSGDSVQPACDDSIPPAVDFALAPVNARLVEQSLAMQTPSGERPLGPALRGAIERMSADDVALLHRNVVIVTASTPNACTPTAISELAALVGAPTFAIPSIIALGGAPEELLAIAGPYGIKYAIVDGDVTRQIVDALAEIPNKRLPGCAVELPPVPQGEFVDFNRVSVDISFSDVKMAVPRLLNASDCTLNLDKGWYVDADDPHRLMLCPETCEQGTIGRLGIGLGCVHVATAK